MPRTLIPRRIQPWLLAGAFLLLLTMTSSVQAQYSSHITYYNNGRLYSYRAVYGRGYLSSGVTYAHNGRLYSFGSSYGRGYYHRPRAGHRRSRR